MTEDNPNFRHGLWWCPIKACGCCFASEHDLKLHMKSGNHNWKYQYQQSKPKPKRKPQTKIYRF